MTARSLVCCVIVLVLTPTLVGAQTAAAFQAAGDTARISFAGLAGKLTVGQRVIVVDRNGLEISGLVDSLSLTSLRLMVDGQERDFPATEVRAIFRPERGAGRGAWIGLVVGAGIGVWPAAALGAFGAPAILGGIGAGIGALVGSAFVHRKQIYETTPDPARPTGERVVPPRAPEVPSVQAIAPNLARPRPDRKWAAAFLMGPTSSGPARDLEQAMRDAQFDESRFCVFVCSGSDPHPVSQTGFGAEGFPWHLSLQRRLSPWAALGVSAGHAAIGRTNGLKRDRFLDYLLISYGVTTVAPLFIIGPAEGFHAAAGPALFSTGFRDVGARGGQRGSHRNLGFVTEFGMAVPPRSPVFGELLVQYRHVGNVEAGPFTTSASVYGVGSTLPAAEVGMNHWFVGFGAGVRF